MITVIGRRLVPLLAVLLLCAVAGRGQGTVPAEFSLGYSYMRTNAPPGQCGCFGMNGGSLTFAVPLGRGISAVTDLGDYYQKNVVGSNLGMNLESYLFGARYSYRHWKKTTPFAQLMVGGAHAHGTLFGTPTTTASASGFAYDAGAGVDMKITKSMSIRLIEADYILTRVPNGGNNDQGNLRITAGVVFRLGASSH
jgi:peptidoglycan-associated lipoprotein